MSRSTKSHFSPVAELGDVPRPGDVLVEKAGMLIAYINSMPDQLLRGTLEASPFLDFALLHVQGPNVAHTFTVKQIPRLNAGKDESVIGISNLSHQFNFFEATDALLAINVCKHIGRQLEEKLSEQQEREISRRTGQKHVPAR